MLKSYEEVKKEYNLSGNQCQAILDRGVSIKNVTITPKVVNGVIMFNVVVKEYCGSKEL